MNPNNFYEYSNESEEELRLPDNVYTDRLIDNRDKEELEMEKILNESIFLAERNSEEKYQELIEEMNIRKQRFESLLLKFKKIVNYDKDIKEIFNLIDWIIEYYINMQIENYTYDKETYDKIFNIKLLKQIRLNDSEINLLSEIISFDLH